MTLLHICTTIRCRTELFERCNICILPPPRRETIDSRTKYVCVFFVYRKIKRHRQNFNRSLQLFTVCLCIYILNEYTKYLCVCVLYACASDMKIYVFRLVVSKIVRFYTLNLFAVSEISKIKTMIYTSICFTPWNNHNNNILYSRRWRAWLYAYTFIHRAPQSCAVCSNNTIVFATSSSAWFNLHDALSYV